MIFKHRVSILIAENLSFLFRHQEIAILDDWLKSVKLDQQMTKKSKTLFGKCQDTKCTVDPIVGSREEKPSKIYDKANQKREPPADSIIRHFFQLSKLIDL